MSPPHPQRRYPSASLKDRLRPNVPPALWTITCNRPYRDTCAVYWRCVGVVNVPKANSHSVDKAIGGRLKLFRQRANFSQTALGKSLGVSFQQVQKYENGTNRISAASLMKIARFLNISIGDLLSPQGQTDGKKAAST